MREAYSMVWSVLVLLFRSRVSLEAECQIAFNYDPPFAFNGGSDSLLMKFTGDLRFSNGESAPCGRTFKFHP